MNKLAPHDPSNGYEEVAESFMALRNQDIGVAIVREWSHTLPPGSSILDLGCGHGIPVSQALIEEGFAVFGIDASAKMIAAFDARFPQVQAECAAVEESGFFSRQFDGVAAVGLMFLLAVDVQTLVIRKVAQALHPGGKFLFTSPKECCTWKDLQTGRESISLGAEAYHQILRAEGLVLDGEQIDGGGNHYYLASKPRRRVPDTQGTAVIKG
jgi:2-polyprenyl-3-methyl-5-hydroxy-6-metoxy-1,4-benzoquinol methylase